MAGVCADVATLVVSVDGQVQPHQLCEVRLVIVAKHRGEVGRPILIRVNAANLSVTVEVPVDGSGQRGQLGYQVHSILIHILWILKVCVCVCVAYIQKYMYVNIIRGVTMTTTDKIYCI